MLRIDRFALEGVIDEVGSQNKSFPSRNRQQRGTLPDTLTSLPPFTPRPIVERAVDDTNVSGLFEGLVQHSTCVPLAFSLDLVRFTVEAILRRDSGAVPDMLGLDVLLELPLPKAHTNQTATSTPRVTLNRISAKRLLSSHKETVSLESHDVHRSTGLVMRRPSIDRLLSTTGFQLVPAQCVQRAVCGDTINSPPESANQTGSETCANTDLASVEDETVEAFFAGYAGGGGGGGVGGKRHRTGSEVALPLTIRISQNRFRCTVLLFVAKLQALMFAAAATS